MDVEEKGHLNSYSDRTPAERPYITHVLPRSNLSSPTLLIYWERALHMLYPYDPLQAFTRIDDYNNCSKWASWDYQDALKQIDRALKVKDAYQWEQLSCYNLTEPQKDTLSQALITLNFLKFNHKQMQQGHSYSLLTQILQPILTTLYNRTRPIHLSHYFDLYTSTLSLTMEEHAQWLGTPLPPPSHQIFNESRCKYITISDNSIAGGDYGSYKLWKGDDLELEMIQLSDGLVILKDYCSYDPVYLGHRREVYCGDLKYIRHMFELEIDVEKYKRLELIFPFGYPTILKLGDDEYQVERSISLGIYRIKK
jgi:hypothetical protein